MRVAEGVEAVLGRTAALLPECDARQVGGVGRGMGVFVCLSWRLDDAIA